MKKLIFSLVLFLSFSTFVHAQWTTSGTNIYYTGGNVGIGTNNPQANLSFQNVSTDTGSSGITWFSTSPLNYGIYRTPGSWTAPDYQQMKIQWDTGILLYPGNQFGKSYVEVAGGGLRVTSGNVGIGTTDTKGYLFAVNGSAIATSVTVKAAGTWPDYVFKKDYRLPSLQEVKVYIDQNQHLPEIPSEEQIAKDGLNLGDMNKLLMKKVEELTLYLIEQNKRIDRQQQQINTLLKK